MDELEISGKRYISSKRIAKENKYHSDYIGQLIRAGRVAGTKVGRAWYVDEESFAEYLNKENGTYVAPKVELAQVEIKPAQQPLDETDVSRAGSASASTDVSVSLPSPLHVTPEQSFSAVPQNRSESFAQAKEKEIEIKKEEIFIPQVFVPQKKVEQIKKPGLTYISDSSPLFPEITRRTTPIQKPEVRVQKIVPVAVKETAVVIRPKPAKKSTPLKTGIAVFSLTTLAAVVLSLVFFGSLDINSTVIVEKGKPASVAYSQNETLCFIFGTCQSN